jgi:hypothetical protein
MHTVDLTPPQWYAEAARCYVEEHQGCPWCGGQHRVHQVRQGQKISFACQRCDFQVSFDGQTGRFHMIPGEDLSNIPETMLGYPLIKS